MWPLPPLVALLRGLRTCVWMLSRSPVVWRSLWRACAWVGWLAWRRPPLEGFAALALPSLALAFRFAAGVAVPCPLAPVAASAASSGRAWFRVLSGRPCGRSAPRCLASGMTPVCSQPSQLATRCWSWLVVAWAWVAVSAVVLLAGLLRCRLPSPRCRLPLCSRGRVSRSAPPRRSPAWGSCWCIPQ